MGNNNLALLESNLEDTQLSFSRETGNHCLIIGDGLDYTVYVIDVKGKILHTDYYGFSVGNCRIPNVETYIKFYELSNKIKDRADYYYELNKWFRANGDSEVANDYEVLAKGERDALDTERRAKQRSLEIHERKTFILN